MQLSMKIVSAISSQVYSYTLSHILNVSVELNLLLCKC